MQKIRKTFRKYFVVFCGLIAAYVLSMTLVNLIPGDWMQDNYMEAITGFEREESWMLDPFLDGTEMDGVAEYQILSQCLTMDPSRPLYSAMKYYYPRYWHGYVIFMKPLLTFIGYGQIKYVNMMACFLLLCVLYEKVKNICGKKTGLALALALCMGNISAVPLLQQYMSMYYITEIGMIVYCTRYQKHKLKDTGLFFLVMGSVTNFFDFLTAPLLSLGLPLVLALMLYEREEDYTFAKGFWFMIKNSVIWALSYAFTWISKWCISSVILHQNVIKNALDQAVVRTKGVSDAPGNPLDAIAKNLGIMFPWITLVFFGALFVLWCILLIKRRPDFRMFHRHLPILFCAAYPFLWYVVLASHSQIHAHFTYRILEITVFAVLVFMILCLDGEKKDGIKN